MTMGMDEGIIYAPSIDTGGKEVYNPVYTFMLILMKNTPRIETGRGDSICVS